MPPDEWVESVGVDVGTTTTQVVVSRLRVSNPPASDAALRPEIRERAVIHRSPIVETPLVDPETVDVVAVAAVVETALAAVDRSPADIDTGAVIVTGEAAKRENAERLVHRIAADAGDFVAAAAGASFEAVLAGRGSGAATRAAETGETVANVDVGGGTTNVAIFEGDRVVETRCLDVGARLVRVTDARISAIAPQVTELIASNGLDSSNGLDRSSGLDLAIGDEASDGALRPVARNAAQLIADLLAGPPFDLRTEALLIGERPSARIDLDAVVVTGGVGAIMNEHSLNADADNADANVDPFRHGDLGPLLAAELRTALAERLPDVDLIALDEDLRATVVGVGTEATTFSGRTIWLDPSLLPLRDVPIVVVGSVADGPESSDPDTPTSKFLQALATATDLYGLDAEQADGDTAPDALGLYIGEIGSLTYGTLQRVADALAHALAATGYPTTLPLVIVTRQNCAKALGQALHGRLDAPYLVIDELELTADDRLDIGEPLAGRDAVPVVTKTLAFGEGHF
ncbi:ethanolamine ammonia-lyase reactivating factor EutA [Halorubrum vacuolatum]|uniref:Ethanolamine utilization protein EutA n=1 Tax=Halorubrum vacuolatum TaxID=63740 RepID=A0A238WU26_HALVU|nr:ethanolamine ammonia-lyase reactivating factor EutA [Halorubrum vacuolatum]SNR50052.1 ethanolamine utilization protein EutA [Halorubrum vacuolatum]